MKKKQMVKLLNRILKTDAISFEEISGGKVWYTRRGDTLSSYVGVTKLQSKCKKWAAKHGIPIFSTTTEDGGIAMIDAEAEIFVPAEISSTEHEAVYDVCYSAMMFMDKMEK